jgi:glycosyltransferase involved in cell wall biosynthesis
MRIVVVEPDGAGGMLHYAFQMCTALAEEGADVTLVTSQHYELAGVPAPFHVAPIMRLWPAIEPMHRHRRPGRILAALGHKLRRVARAVRYAREWGRVSRFILREQPDVAQFAIIRFPFLAWYLRKLSRAGTTLTQVCHEFEPREARGPLRAIHRALSHSVYRWFSLIFLHGDENRARFLATHPVDPAVTRTIPHGDESLFLRVSTPGGDLRDRYDIPPDRPVALFFGGLRPSKGIDDLIDAYAGVVEQVDAHLLVVGPPAGVDPEHLRHRAECDGITDRVTIDPHYLPIAEVGLLMATADVVALPYRSATASGVLQVAYAFGRPVVATEVGALIEDVVHGDTGLLVPPRDRAALTSALVKLLADPVEARRMGTQARRRAEEGYAWPPIARSVLDAYRDIA